MEKRKLLISKEELLEQYQKLHSLRKIAKYYGCDADTVRNRMIEYGIERNQDKKFTCNIEQLRSLYEEHKSTEKVAEILGCTAPTILVLLRENNIPVQKNGALRKYTMNEEFFSQDSEKSMYWAGFCAADGNIDKKYPQLRIAISSKDTEHLEQFKNDIQSNAVIGSVVHNNKTTNKSYNSVYLKLTSDKFVNDLARFNIVPNKTFIYTIPDWIIDHPHANAFLRGYFDGDGTFTIMHDNGVDRPIFRIIGPLAAMETFRTILENNTTITKNRTIGKDRNIFTLTYAAKSDVQAIVDYLYKDATVYLKRKFKVALFGLYGLNNKNATFSSGASIV
jgi:intein-encoded DNA endonuclease-like protein